MDVKAPGNLIYIVGMTADEMGGSHWSLVRNLEGGAVPRCDPQRAKRIFEAVHTAIRSGFVRACHDLSEGGLAVAAAEMAFAGCWGVELDLTRLPCDPASLPAIVRLFSESNTRFLCEVDPQHRSAFEALFTNLPLAEIGKVTECDRLMIRFAGRTLIDLPISRLKEAWLAPLAW